MAHLTATKTILVTSVIYFSVFSLSILLKIHLISLDSSNVIKGITTDVTTQPKAFKSISFMIC